jgi:aspartate racemase
MENSMKTIGIIGGMSWQSSAEYYRLINQRMSNVLGPTHSAELVMYSLNFNAVAQLELEDRWSELAVVIVDTAKRLERAGAEFILLASNTAHKVADLVQASIEIPLLHIADAAAEAIAAAGISTVGLLGTRFVMQQDFYRDRLRDRGIDVVIPDEAGRNCAHDIIYNELCAGQLLAPSRERLRKIILDLQRAKAEAVVLACTELPLLIRPEDSPVKLFDTLAIHVEKAVTFALEA